MNIERKTSTNSKNCQLKEIQRYCDLDYSKNKCTINSIYNTPRDKLDGRKNNKGGNNRIYIDSIETIITGLINKSNYHSPVYVSRSSLKYRLGFINKSFILFQNNKKYREGLLSSTYWNNIDTQQIKYFYNSTNSKINGILNSALDNIYKDTNNIKCNRVQIIVHSGSHNARTSVATEQENELTKITQDILLSKYDCKDISEIVLKSLSGKFYKDVTKTINEKYNMDWEYYYPAYEFIFDRDKLDINITNTHIVEARKSNHAALINSINKHNIKNYEAHSDINSLTNNYFDNLLYGNSFLEIQNILNTEFLDMGDKEIKELLKSDRDVFDKYRLTTSLN